jgi:prolyl 4-hydroxylase
MIIRKFEPKWKAWIWNNISDGQNIDGIFTILLNHGFEYDLIKRELEYDPTNRFIIERKERQISLETTGILDISNFNTNFRDNPKCHRIENNFLEVYKYPNFLSANECDDLIVDISENLQESTITNPNGNKKDRTSLSAYMSGNNPKFVSIDEKIHDFMKIPKKNGEGIQGQKYLIGQEFKPHTDFFHETEEYNIKHIGDRGQRTWTFLLYLDTPEEGGETQFTKININIKPIKGMALFWNNLLPDFKGNVYSTHAGLPIIKGEKNIITKWFRQN